MGASDGASDGASNGAGVGAGVGASVGANVGANASADEVARRARTIAGCLLAHALAQPDAPFAIAPETGRTLSYGELAAYAGRLAQHLAEAGAGPGSHVAFLLPNGLTAVALFTAIMAAGRVAAPINLLAQRTQLAYVLEHCDARVIFTCAAERARVDAAIAGRQDQPMVIELDPDVIEPDAGRSTDPAHSADAWAALQQIAAASSAGDDALLMYTSGTTGQPKGALLTNANLLSAAAAVVQSHSLTPHDRVLSALPLYHINGQVIATISPLLAGGSIVAPQRFSVSGWWQQVVQFRPTWLNMVPTIIAYLLNHDRDQGEPDAGPALKAALAGVRFGRSASAPLPPEHHRAFEERFGIVMIEAMGMTESASVVFCNPMPPAARMIGSPGRPLAVEAKVVDQAGAPVVSGVTGEIWLRGPNVMRGYYKSPEQTRAAFSADGWLKSGDLGHCDAQGFFFISGRLKELIIKGGENIAPREIDEALLRHPAVLEAAAAGVPDPALGQEIAAWVVLRPDAVCSTAALREFCLVELGRFKTPREFHFVRELPKGPSGKIQRLKLLELR